MGEGDPVERAVRRKLAERAAEEEARVAKEKEIAERVADVSSRRAARASASRELAERFVQWAVHHRIPYDFRSWRAKGWRVSRYHYLEYGPYGSDSNASSDVYITPNYKLLHAGSMRPVAYEELETRDFEDVIAEQVIRHGEPWD